MLPSWMRSRNCRPRFGVLLGDRDDQTQVGLDQLFLRLLGLVFAADDRVERLLEIGRLLFQRVSERLELDLLILLLAQQRLAVFLTQLVLAVLRAEHLVDALDLALDRLHLFDRRLHLVDQPALDRLGELDLADPLRQLDQRAHRGPARLPVLPLLARRRALRRIRELLEQLLGHFAGLADGLDLPLDLLRPLLDALVGDFLVVEDDELANRPIAAAQLIAEQDHLLRDQRRAGNRLDDGELAPLDAPRDLDLALAREQRHGAHLAQVHPDRIVGLVQRARRQVELDLFGPLGGPIDRLLVPQVLLVRVDDLDAGAAERVEQIVELVRRRDLGRQQLVDFVVQQVTLFLADVNQLPYFVVFFLNRHSLILAGPDPAP